MKKLKLDLSSLRVESFEAAAGHGPRNGTVRANSDEPIDPSGGESCAVTACLTCLCPHSGPQPSCMPCSDIQYCDTFPPIC
jgi:hypothetical protein